ncbi:hypothetical protein CYR40_08295 [Chimaeribacter arupi]|nr:hypothetical protein CYR40_08295 [Chimaeribacter arupi]
MKSHDPKRIANVEVRQEWRAFSYLMQAHENHYIKRAGVAGLRARDSLTSRKSSRQGCTTRL